MNAQETLEASALMREYAEEWQRTGREPMWLQVGAPIAESDYMFCAPPMWNWQHCHYRRRPEPKTVPLTVEDMAPGIQFKLLKGPNEFYAPNWGNEYSVEFADKQVLTYTELANDYMYRTPANPEWRPCMKEVQ